MRALLKTFYVVLALIAFIGAVNLAFVLIEVYWIVSGRFQPGETIEYFEAPARPLSELAVTTFVILAVIYLAVFGQRCLKRWSTSHNLSLKPTADEKPTSSETPGSDNGLT
jgi:hypothetical protein